MTATWMVLLYGDEGYWSSATPELKDQIMGEHRAYAAACAERGYKMLGGEELGYSTAALTVRHEGGSVEVTDGPFSETTEYLGGYYVFETDDPRGLAQLTGEVLVSDGGRGGAELRPVIMQS